MTPLCFRTPGVPLTALALLARLWPGSDPGELRRRLAEGVLRRARIGPGGWRPGASLRDPDAALAPGTALCVRGDPPASPDLPERAAAWQALAPALPWQRGVLAADSEVGFAHQGERAGVALYRLAAPGAAGSDGLPAGVVLDAVAAAGAPVLGDARRGGVLLAGGLRLRSVGVTGDAPPPEGFWPDEPVHAPDLESGDPRATLEVSAATRRALGRGHPWVLRDAETGDTERFRPGALVRLGEAGAGKRAGLRVRVEPRGGVAARLWADAGGDAPSVEARVAAALKRRAALRRDPATDAFRLIHGEADGLPGLAVDRLGPLLRCVVTARCAEPLLGRALDAAAGILRRELDPDPPVIVAFCLRDPPRGRLQGVRRLRGPEPELDAAGRLRVREAGRGFLVDPGLAEPDRPRPGVGLFLDQRENRARVAARVRPGGRYLNLFAHTGAFSVALLAAGAARVVSVDLSAAYLAWLQENLEANGLGGARHESVHSDARRFLERLPPAERFAGIVLDPPTAAAAGRRFWSVRRDLEPLAEAALGRLEPGGWLLLARNDRRAAGASEDWIPKRARQAGVALERVEPAPPGPDFPALAGFPEGGPFRAWLLRRT